MGQGFLLWCVLAGCPDPDPPAEDVWRFPGQVEIAYQKDFCCRHEVWGQAARLMAPPYDQGWWDEWQAELLWRWGVWCCLGDAWLLREVNPYVARQHLARLKRLIGDEAYYAGRLPDVVPIWAFRCMDR